MILRAGTHVSGNMFDVCREMKWADFSFVDGPDPDGTLEPWDIPDDVVAQRVNQKIYLRASDTKVAH